MLVPEEILLVDVGDYNLSLHFITLHFIRDADSGVIV